jgi:hypothetical protein
MTRDAQSFEDIGPLADEVSRMIVSRFGGARRGERPALETMIKRRGGALPRKLQRAARRLATADRMTAQPKIARQLDLAAVRRDHHDLMAHLQPLGEISRWQGRAISFAASIVFGLMVLAVVVIWLMVRRGQL